MLEKVHQLIVYDAFKTDQNINILSNWTSDMKIWHLPIRAGILIVNYVIAITERIQFRGVCSL